MKISERNMTHKLSKLPLKVSRRLVGKKKLGNRDQRNGLRIRLTDAYKMDNSTFHCLNVMKSYFNLARELLNLNKMKLLIIEKLI